MRPGRWAIDDAAIAPGKQYSFWRRCCRSACARSVRACRERAWIQVCHGKYAALGRACGIAVGAAAGAGSCGSPAVQPSSATAAATIGLGSTPYSFCISLALEVRRGRPLALSGVYLVPPRCRKRQPNRNACSSITHQALVGLFWLMHALHFLAETGSRRILRTPTCARAQEIRHSAGSRSWGWATVTAGQEQFSGVLAAAAPWRK